MASPVIFTHYLNSYIKSGKMYIVSLEPHGDKPRPVVQRVRKVSIRN